MLDQAERQKKIESYASAYDQLVKALEQFPHEMWSFKPAPTEWSIHEIIVHIADSEANSYTRFRKMIAEPGSAIADYEQDTWARALNYAEQSTEDALELFRWLRGNSYKLLKTLPPEMWSHTYQHPAKGSVNMDDWLVTYENHIPLHIRQMQANHAAWQHYAK